MTNKEVLTSAVPESQLPTDEAGNKADVFIDNESPVPVERYTETDALKEAGTNAHANVEGAEHLKARVQEVVNIDKSLPGLTHRISEEMWDAVANELTATTMKLRLTKSIEDRSELIEQIQQLNSKLSILLETFIA